jgi:hypothetical protein
MGTNSQLSCSRAVGHSPKEKIGSRNRATLLGDALPEGEQEEHRTSSRFADVFAFCPLHCRNAGGLKLRVEP